MGGGRERVTSVDHWAAIVLSKEHLRSGLKVYSSFLLLHKGHAGNGWAKEMQQSRIKETEQK